MATSVVFSSTLLQPISHPIDWLGLLIGKIIYCLEGKTVAVAQFLWWEKFHLFPRRSKTTLDHLNASQFFRGARSVPTSHITKFSTEYLAFRTLQTCSRVVLSESLYDFKLEVVVVRIYGNFANDCQYSVA